MLPGEDAHWDQAQKNLILSEFDDLLAAAANMLVVESPSSVFCF